MRLALLLAFVLLFAGCASPSAPTQNATTSPSVSTPPPPIAERAPTQNATSSTNNSTTGAPADTPPPRLDGDENADLRVRIAGHSSNDTITTLTLDVLDKGTLDLTIRYLSLNTTSGRSFYFEPNAIVPAGQERRIAMNDSSGDASGRHATWTTLAIYYTMGQGTPDGRDGAALLDLSGRGYP